MNEPTQPRLPIHRRWAPLASAALVGLLTFGAVLFILARSPGPPLPPPIHQLQAAGLGERLYLFYERNDATVSPPRETVWMRTVEGGRAGDESEIKPYRSFAVFEGKLWFFSSGMYRVFDGKDWQRYDAPWIGADPVATSAPDGLWILSRLGEDLSLTSYSNDNWDRPRPLPVNPIDRDRICLDRCPSGFVVFKNTILYFWLKDEHLYRFRSDGEHPGTVDTLTDAFGRLKGFSVLADSDRILLWHQPVSAPAPSGEKTRTMTMGLKMDDGSGWRDGPGIDRPAPLGFLESAPVSFQGRTHLLISSGITVEDQVWEAGPAERSALIIGADIGPRLLRYQERLLIRLAVPLVFAVGILSLILNRIKPAEDGANVAYASVGRRFVAKAIDTSLVVVPIGIIVWARFDPAGGLFPNTLADLIASSGREIIIAQVALFAYHALAEGFWGRTLGKRLCGIIVMDQDRKPCTLVQSAVRNLLRLIDAFGLYWVGLLFIAATDRWQRLGDRFGRTIVVRTQP